MKPVMSTHGLSVSYGGVQALVDVDLHVAEGELVGLIGPNGAGKTTFIDAVTGFAGSRGSVVLGGEDISRLAPHRRARRGLARTWQTIELFDDLSVEQNLMAAASHPSFRDTVRETLRGPDPASGWIAEVLALLELGPDADRMPQELSQGRRKLVGVGRAIVQRPQLLLLDEPASGLDTSESAVLGKRLRAVVDAGTPMLLIDHDMGLVLSICDRIVVLNFGEVIAEGKPEAVSRDRQVIEAYLGSSAGELTDAVAAEVEQAAGQQR